MKVALRIAFPVVGALLSVTAGYAGQAPFKTAATDIPVSHRDRVYAAEQFSNTVSVIDPASNRLLGVIRLGEPQPANFSPLFTPDGKEVWVTVRGEDYVSVLDRKTFAETGRIRTPGGPGMTIFSPDGRYGYVCSSFNPVLTIFDARTRRQVGQVAQPGPFCPNIAATPDGAQVWYTLKDLGKTVAIDARPPFVVLMVIATDPISAHVNFADTPHGSFAYVTVGGRNEVLVFRRDSFERVAAIPVGNLPHGIWPSGDGSRMYFGLENGDAVTAIDTATNRVIAVVPVGQAPQALVYVPGAVPAGEGLDGLQPLGPAGSAARLVLRSPGSTSDSTTVTLFDQGLVQILQAAVTGLQPTAPYVLAMAVHPDGSGPLESLAAFMTNPAGAAIVNVAGPIRQLVTGAAEPDARHWLVVAPGKPGNPGRVVQVQLD